MWTGIGQEAMDYFQGTGKFANRQAFPLSYLVLLDLKLPLVMVGLEVLKWIRQQPNTTVIVVIPSSSSSGADIATSYRLGAYGYLVKPPDIYQLTAMAKAIKDFWLTQNTPPDGVTSRVTPHGQSGRDDGIVGKRKNR